MLSSNDLSIQLSANSHCSSFTVLAMRVMATRTKSRYPNLQAFSFTDIRVATSNFSHENKLGEGGFGPVYKVLYALQCCVLSLHSIFD